MNEAPNHYENFPVASLLCPAALRPAVVALYHFARTADDIADEGNASAAQRLADLKRYRQSLTAICPPSPAPDPEWAWVFDPLARVVHEYGLPTSLLHDLLDAFEQDVDMTERGHMYLDEAHLLDYCRRSANPVGRLVLHLYGVNQEAALRRSDAVCSALQLINFWQDCSVDLPRGRCYFPRTWMDAYGTSLQSLRARDHHPHNQALIAHSVAHARALMLSGAPLVHQVKGRAGWELRLVVQGGLRVLEQVEQLGAGVLVHRPRLHAPDYVRMLWRALRM
jgi:squalene synthase HpnC